MGAAGRRRVDPAFRAETMVAQIAEVYAMLIKRYPERIARFNKRHPRAEVANTIKDAPV
jgi:hypothetical protein